MFSSKFARQLFQDPPAQEVLGGGGRYFIKFISLVPETWIADNISPETVLQMQRTPFENPARKNYFDYIYSIEFIVD